jgi:hypothetical protein
MEDESVLANDVAQRDHLGADGENQIRVIVNALWHGERSSASVTVGAFTIRSAATFFNAGMRAIARVADRSCSTVNGWQPDQETVGHSTSFVS